MKVDSGCRKDAWNVTDVIGVSAIIGKCGNVKFARSLIKGEYRIDPPIDPLALSVGPVS